MSSAHCITQENANYIADIGADVQSTHSRTLRRRQRNAFVPAVNLPPEVLSIIFEFATDDESETADDCSPVSPLFIGSICSMWRNVAWGAPRLWSTITISYYDDEAEKQAEMLDYWLAKSGELPLTVDLVEMEPDSTTDTSVKVIEAVVAYAHRLHTFELFLPSSWEPALTRIASCMPGMLTRLTLHASHDRLMILPRIGEINFFANALQLREVSLFDYYTEDVGLPWAQLESLKSDYYDIFELAKKFNLCRHLRRCSISVDEMVLTGPPSVVLRHTTLETLEVCNLFGDKNERTELLLETLELPVLRSFTLNVSRTPSEWSSWLLPFLSHVAGTLETLSLYPAFPMGEELLAVLRVVPGLRKLVLLDLINNPSQEKGLTQKTLDLMNPAKCEELEREVNGQSDGQGDGDGDKAAGLDERRNRHCLVPNLETFEYEGEIDFSSHALVEFLVARWRGCSTPTGCLSGQLETGDPSLPSVDTPSARLRSVIIQTPEQIQFEDADVEVVQELGLEGMDLEFLEDPH